MKNIFISLFFLIAIFQAGCSKQPLPPKINLSEANAKFEKFCKDEHHYTVYTKVAGTTLWIYYPVRQNIIEVKASREGAEVNKEVKIKPAINYLEGDFADGTFSFDYDISSARNYKKSYGYASNYSEQYQKLQQNILTSIQQNYFDAQEQPQFIVLVVSDIINGVEMESIFYFEDLKKTMGMMASLTQEEFVRRYVYELRGSLSIINDEKGQHIYYREITLPYFLTKQIINRVRFKFERSSFPPSDDYPKEILAVTAEAFKAYDFQNFTTIKLNNLVDGKSTVAEKSKLQDLPAP